MATIALGPPGGKKYRSWISENQGLGTWDDTRDWIWAHPTAFTLSAEEDNLALSSSYNRDISLHKTEPLRYKVIASNGFIRPLSESFELNSAFKRLLTWQHAIAESFELSESTPIKTLDKNLSEAFELKEERNAEVYKAISEALQVIDECNRKVSFIRKISENYTFSKTAHPKIVSLFKTSSIGFYDVIKEVARGVISDLLFQEGIWTKESLDKFMRNGGRHVGYGTFREFITGDYEYQKALFRLALEASTADRALVENIEIAVDVDDVYDRGASTVTDRNFGVNVTFDRVFSIAPEITVTMRSGNALEAIRPVVSNVTTTGFNVTLYDVENNKTTGTFTWLASGY